MRKIAALVVLSFLLVQQLRASNISVSNVILTSQDTTTGSTRVRLDLSWEYSWRYGLNANINSHDAAWVFVKFRVGATDYTSTATATSSGTTITVNTTSGLRVGMPVWVASGTGAFTSNSVITAILNQTQFTVNETPSTPLNNAVVRASRIWEHAYLGTAAQHSTGTGTSATLLNGLANPFTAFDSAANPGLGVFVYRSAEGYGTFTQTGLELRWNYRMNNVGHDDVVEVRAFGLEMVFVPEGAFFVGDGSSTLAGQFRNGNAATPYLIASEAALTLGGTDSINLANSNATGMSVADDYNNSTTQTLPGAYPKGVRAAYVMKYEISQQQYVDFLNSLNRIHQNNRTETDLAPGVTSVTNRYVLSGSSSLTARNGIRINASIPSNGVLSFYCDLNGNGTGSEAGDGQFIACNFLSWADVAAYMDWSALRPLTELEYEKAARGQQQAVANAYAWASTSITAAAAISLGGQSGENSSTTNANAVYGNQGGVPGPLRVGSFTDTTAGRAQSGSGLWGILELSGNVAEAVVNTGTAEGRAFTGQHGDGEIRRNGASNLALGNANTANWPDSSGTGYGLRGGSWSAAANDLRTSDRRLAVNSSAARSANAGGRGIRNSGCAVLNETISVTGNSIPLGGTASFSASGSSGGYWWIVPNGWEIVSGQGTANVEIFANAPGIIRVAALNDCGCGPETLVTVTVE